MTLIKRDRAINIDEPSVGAILQSGNNFNSIDSFDDKSMEQDLEAETIFPIGHGKRYKTKFHI